MAFSATEQHFVSNKISEVLEHFNVATNHAALRAELERDCIVDSTGRDAYVRVVTSDGRELSLRERVAELKGDEKFKSAFPAPQSKRISKTDLSKLRENFNDVASGKIAVE